MNLFYFTTTTSEILTPNRLREFCKSHKYKFEINLYGWGIVSNDFGLYGGHNWLDNHNPDKNQFDENSLLIDSIYYERCTGDWDKCIRELNDEICNDRLELYDEVIDEFACRGEYKYIEDEIIARRNSVNELRSNFGLSVIEYDQIDKNQHTPYETVITKVSHPLSESKPKSNDSFDKLLFG